MHAPHKIVMTDKNLRGPILRRTTVAGGWKRTYGMKNMSAMTVYLFPIRLSSTAILHPLVTVMLRVYQILPCYIS